MKRIFATVKDAFTTFCSLIDRVEISSIIRHDKYQTGLLHKYILHKNLRHVLLFSLLLVITVVMGVAFNIVNNLSILRLMGELLLLADGIVGFCFCLRFIGSQKLSQKSASIFLMLFWCAFLTGAMLIVTDEFTVLNYSPTYYAMMLTLMMIPLVTMRDAVILSVVSFVTTGIISFAILHDVRFLLVALLSSVVFLWSSQLIYYSVANQWLYKRRLNAAVERCRMISETDSESGLLNKNGLLVRFREIVHSYQKHSAVSAIMIDIDNYKEYNFRYTYNVGNETFAAVSKCIKVATQQAGVELVSRFDSDAFLIIAEDRSEYDTIALAEQIRKDIEILGIEYANSGYGIVTVSTGIVFFDKGYSETEGDIINAADFQLEVAKAGGGNCVAYKNRIFRQEK